MSTCRKKSICRGMRIPLALLLAMASGWVFFQHAADAVALHAVTLLVVGVVILASLAEGPAR